MPTRSNRLDLFLLILLFLMIALYAIFFVNFNAHPIEDAAMLMRYSKHLAEGHGIVWNIGEAPVDGATDFLFMVWIAALVKLGMSLDFATRFLGLSAHFLTMAVIFLSLRKTFNAPHLIAFCCALFLLAGPGFFFTVGYFGTTVFVLFACISWWLALDIIQFGENKKKAWLFAFAALTTGLIRPEGVLLTGLMMLVILFLNGWKKSKQTLVTFISVFLILGGAYFLWRWNYFGYPLPNPFYKKSGGGLHPESLQAAYVHVFFLNLWLFPAFIVGIIFKETRLKAITYLGLIIGFATFFILIANYMNVLGRFQYVTLPLALMCVWSLTLGFWNWLKVPKLTPHQRFFYSALLLILFAITATLQHKVYNVRYHYDGKYYVAKMLSEYKDKGYRLAMSEAGLLPLYSEWKSLDTWGLNDQWIAHNGKITEAYLDEFDPHIIMFYAYFSPVVSITPKDDFDEMTIFLRDYAESHNFILAAAYGETPYLTEYYYVRADFPDSAEIIRKIQEMDYPSYKSGALQINYAIEQPSP